MIQIHLNMLILRPVWVVFNFIATPENNPEWQYGSLASVKTFAGETQVGTIFSSFGHFMGRRIQSDFEVTEFETNRSYGFETISGPIQLQTSYTFEAVPHGTNVIVSSLINPGGFFKLVDPIVARVARKQFNENLVRLKEIIEAKEVVSSHLKNSLLFIRNIILDRPVFVGYRINLIRITSSAVVAAVISLSIPARSPTSA